MSFDFVRRNDQPAEGVGGVVRGSISPLNSRPNERLQLVECCIQIIKAGVNGLILLNSVQHIALIHDSGPPERRTVVSAALR